MENIEESKLQQVEMGEEETQVSSYKIILKQKPYVTFISSNLINRFGDSIDSLAFAWLIYMITGSASWSAAIFGINRIPTVFLQPIAGAIVETRTKKRIIIAMDLIRGLCVLLVAVFFILDLLSPYLLVAITIVISSAEAFRNPASTAFLPLILRPKDYEYGISLNTSLSTIVELVGLGLAGGIIALGGIQAAILIDAFTFFASAGIIMLIKVKEPIKDVHKINLSDSIETFKEGFTYIKSNKLIVSFLLITFVTNGLLVPMNSLQAPLVKEVYGQGEMMLSAIGVAFSIGMFGGSLLYPYVAAKVTSKRLIIVGGINYGIYSIGLMLVEPLKHNAILLYLFIAFLSFFAGIGIAFMVNVLNVGFVKNVEPEYMARAGAILNSVAVAAIPILSVLTSLLVKITSIQMIFAVTGILTVILFLSFHFQKKLIL